MKFLVNADERSLELAPAFARSFGAAVTILESVETRGQGQPAVERLQALGLETELVQRPTNWLRALQVVTRAYKYELAVVGKMWQRGIRRLAFGGVPPSLLSDVRTNLLIVRHRRDHVARLLLAVGAGPTTRQVVRWGGLVARAFDAQPVLFHVAAQLPGMFFGLSTRRESLSQFMRSNTVESRAFEHARETLQLLEITPELKLGYGDVVEETIEEARTGDYDLIVVGSSYAGGSSARLFMETVTERLVQRAPCPVLVVREAIDPGIFRK